MKKKSIIVLGAGQQQIPAISRAHYLGFHVISPDLNPEAPGLDMVEYPLPNISTHDPEIVIGKLIELKRKNLAVSGIVAVGVEASHTVARVAEKFGLVAIPCEIAERTRNKIKRLKCWKKAGVPCPEFGIAQNIEDAKSIAGKIGYPVVFKPVDLAGAQGVVIIKNEKHVDEWFEYTFSKKKSEILIEEYIEGTEHSSESLVDNGTIYTTGFTDRNYDTKFLYPPHLLENGDTTPTLLNKKTYERTLEAVNAAIKALEINVGPAKGDIIINEFGEPKMLEMATRVSGDYFAAYTAPLNNGTDLISAVIQQAAGDNVNINYLTWKYNRGVALRYFWPKLGKIVEINGFEEARTLPGVKFVSWEPYWENQKIGIGTVITKPTSHGERVGSVLTSAVTREEAVEMANYVVKKVKIITNA